VLSSNFTSSRQTVHSQLCHCHTIDTNSCDLCANHDIDEETRMLNLLRFVGESCVLIWHFSSHYFCDEVCRFSHRFRSSNRFSSRPLMTNNPFHVSIAIFCNQNVITLIVVWMIFMRFFISLDFTWNKLCAALSLLN
jgi:hypothetical protein